MVTTERTFLANLLIRELVFEHISETIRQRRGGVQDASAGVSGQKLSSHVVLDGRHAQLQNGNVDCPEESAGSGPCVLLRGTGQHLLKNVSVRSLVAGNESTLIHITSNNNLLTGNTVSLGSAGVGFGIAGNNNILRGNIVRPAGDVAYSISGNKNLLINNSSVALIPFGRFSRNFQIGGDGNTLSHNVVSSGEQSDGAFYLLIPASNNLISRNVIFNNPKPADLPVEQPTKFEFIVNLKTAKEMGLTIPPTVLFRADKIIK
jgi:hypothetical protein